MEEQSGVPGQIVIGGGGTKPQSDRVFYANAINWIVTDQEAVFDFRLVSPEDYQLQVKPTATGAVTGAANVNLTTVPIAVRVIIPRFQFDLLKMKITEVNPPAPARVESGQITKG